VASESFYFDFLDFLGSEGNNVRLYIYAKNNFYLLVTASSMDSLMAVIVTEILVTIFWKKDPAGGVGLTCVSIFIALFLLNICTQDDEPL
jgi:hypothetical protein